jgi:hypothetical protein
LGVIWRVLFADDITIERYRRPPDGGRKSDRGATGTAGIGERPHPAFDDFPMDRRRAGAARRRSAAIRRDGVCGRDPDAPRR